MLHTLFTYYRSQRHGSARASRLATMKVSICAIRCRCSHPSSHLWREERSRETQTLDWSTQGSAIELWLVFYGNILIVLKHHGTWLWLQWSCAVLEPVRLVLASRNVDAYASTCAFYICSLLMLELSHLMSRPKSRDCQYHYSSRMIWRHCRQDSE